MDPDALERERLFMQWHEAKAVHVGFVHRAHLSATIDPKRSAEFMLAASVALGDLQAAHARLLASMPCTSPAR